jgi:hypothetical protein
MENYCPRPGSSRILEHIFNLRDFLVSDPNPSNSSTSWSKSGHSSLIFQLLQILLGFHDAECILITSFVFENLSILFLGIGEFC